MTMMRVFQPGDGTRYRYFFFPLSNGQILWAFGIGSGAMTAYPFDRGADIPFAYYVEKMRGLTDKNLVTFWTGYRALRYILGRATPNWPDDNPVWKEGWQQQLDAGIEPVIWLATLLRTADALRESVAAGAGEAALEYAEGLAVQQDRVALLTNSIDVYARMVSLTHALNKP